MARVIVKCVFAALLALVSAQAVVPSTRTLAPIEAVCGALRKQSIPSESTRTQRDARVQQPAPAYSSRTTPVPDIAVLLPRPPPFPFL